MLRFLIFIGKRRRNQVKLFQRDFFNGLLDITLLKKLHDQYQASVAGIATWKGQAIRERHSIRGDSTQYEYRQTSTIDFAMDRQRNLHRFNQKTIVNRWIAEGKTVDPNQSSENGIKNGLLTANRYYDYSITTVSRNAPRHLVIKELKYADAPQFIFYLPYFINYEPTLGRLKFLLENADNPKLHEWSITQKDSMVILECRFGPDKSYLNRYVFDLSKGAQLISYYIKDDQTDHLTTWEYTQDAGQWILALYLDVITNIREGLKTVSTDKVVLANGKINQSLDDSEFSPEILGLKLGEWVQDDVLGTQYDYRSPADLKIDLNSYINPQPLIHKSLPSLKPLGIRLDPNQINGKHLLLCFFDLNQRPSRAAVLELAKKGPELQQKGLAVVAIQASPVPEAVLKDWLKENKITFPVGMIAAEEKKILAAWGVLSQPWLILADKEHKVVAEGFTLDEIDKTVNSLSALRVD